MSHQQHGPHRVRGGTPERSEARRALERCRRPRRARGPCGAVPGPVLVSLLWRCRWCSSARCSPTCSATRCPTSPVRAGSPRCSARSIFVYGGRPFLTGRCGELRARQPGMMLLIAMAITVAFVASLGDHAGLGGFDLDFWWELAAAGHDHAARALAGDAGARRRPGRARRAGRAAARRGRAGRPTDGPWSTVAARRARASATSCWCAPAAGCRPTARSSRARPSVDESMITGESRPVAAGVGRHGGRRHRRHRHAAAGPGRRGRRRHRAGRHPAPGRRGAGVLVAGAGAGRPGGGAAVLLRRRRRRRSPFVVWTLLGDAGRGRDRGP